MLRAALMALVAGLGLVAPVGAQPVVQGVVVQRLPRLHVYAVQFRRGPLDFWYTYTLVGDQRLAFVLAASIQRQGYQTRVAIAD